MLGWVPDFTLDRGLAQTIVWYENFLNSQQQKVQEQSARLKYPDLKTLPLSKVALQQIAHN